MTNMALYNGERTLVLTVQKAQDANTIEVVDGLMNTLKELRKQIPAGIRLEPVSDGSRQIRVAVDNVRRTLIEGALLTILIVFLFLNSWRSTVITGLTLPISLIGTFWFMSMFGFTINMITLMALSLCVGLLIDDAIVVRENIVRHVQRAASSASSSTSLASPLWQPYSSPCLSVSHWIRCCRVSGMTLAFIRKAKLKSRPAFMTKRWAVSRIGLKFKPTAWLTSTKACWLGP
jgi:multidrug efflux pump subunit AcrB